MKLKKTLATILVLLLFFHQFIIVLADNASDEIITTATQDDVAPTIVDLTNNTGYPNTYHVFKANVTDNENGSGISVVNLEYWYDNENDSTVASMNTANNVTYNISLTLSSNKTKIYYKIHAYDVLNNHNMVEGNVTIYDNDAPTISNIDAYPYVAGINESVNISCTVTDNWNVDSVTVTIVETNFTAEMNNIDTIYYYTLSFDTAGTYHYYITANDTSGNNVTSDTNIFQVVSTTISGGGRKVIQLYVPSTVYEQTSSILMVKLIAVDGSPLSDFASRIHCTIVDPNGNHILDNATPYELRSGIYLCNFTVDDTLGDYIAWATVNYTNNLTFMDTGIFKVLWDIYNNQSRLTERIGDILWLINYQGKNITDTVSFQIREQGDRIIYEMPKREEQSAFYKIIDISLSELYRFIFWTIVVFILVSISAILYGNRRAKKVASNIVDIIRRPQNLITEEGNKKNK